MMAHSPPPATPQLAHIKTMSESLLPPKALSQSNLDIHSDSELNVTFRAKRKREDELDVFKTEVKTMFKEMLQEQKKYFADLNSKMEDLKSQTNDLKQAAEFNSDVYDSFLKRMERLELEKKDDRKKIQHLEEKIELLERQIRSTSIEIRNVPKNINESKQDLVEKVMKLGKALDASVLPSDVKDVFRKNSKTEHKTIIVDFTSTLVKEKIIQSVRKYNKNNANKLNTKNLDIEGPKMPIYVSENLTPKTRRLYFLAREFATQANYKYCWSSFDKVFLRKDDGTSTIRISSEHDINFYKNK